MFKEFKFVKNFKYCIIISCVLMAAGIAGVAALPFGVNLFNFNIDFLGGTILQYELHASMEKVQLDEIGSMVEDITGVSPTIQKSGETGVLIKTVDIDSDKRQAVTDALKEKYNIADSDLLQAENVTPTVGADLRNSAMLSVLIASALILVYIAVRFEFKSGLAAVLALIHDLFVMFSCYVIFQIPVDLNFIAAMLTILGYSINSSVIVFDRIRENRKYMPKTDFAEIVDISSRQTMVRNINTTVTTLLPLLMIILFGVTSVRNFAIPLAVGLAAGAYSSLFLAAPMWNFFRGGKKEKI